MTTLIAICGFLFWACATFVCAVLCYALAFLIIHLWEKY